MAAIEPEALEIPMEIEHKGAMAMRRDRNGCQIFASRLVPGWSGQIASSVLALKTCWLTAWTSGSGWEPQSND